MPYLTNAADPCQSHLDGSRRSPNFFIAGAPKCGTTSLWIYLKDNPEIFLCEPKEPFHFSRDLQGIRPAYSDADYLNLFEGASSDVKAVGEATTLYLYSRTAIEGIHRFNPASKLIVLLRNPVDLVSSWHSQLLYSFDEDEPDLARAWGLQEERSHGQSVPEKCRTPQLLQYRDVASLGEQVERLLRVFPVDQVHFLPLDLLKRDPRVAYLRVLNFLGVADDGRTDFQRFNSAKTSRFNALSLLKRHVTASHPRLDRGMRAAIRSTRIEPLLRRLLNNPQPRPPLDPELRKTLEQDFTKDTRRLVRLVGQEAAPWATAHGEFDATSKPPQLRGPRADR